MLETKIIKVDKNQPERDKIKMAAEIIRKGGLVAFPTETVYGLGGNALDEDAAKKIYAAKGRPQDNPLIVHIWDISQLNQLVKEIPEKARLLMDKFWPGPLTIIFHKNDVVPFGTTGGLDTVAIRMPSHPVALELIKEAGVPIAAPSANISGKPSPVCAEEVAEDMTGRIDMILDGGKASVGVESTVLDLSEEVPIILRPGGVTREELQEVLGRVDLDPGLAPGEKPRSPGQKYRHYAPDAPMTLVEGPIDRQVKTINELAEKLESQGLKVGIMATAQTRHLYTSGHIISAGDRTAPLTISSNIFTILRKFDRLGVDQILAEGISKDGIGLAVMNRLYKAAGYNVIKV
ncbi:threonylcarbamoyl-AMP synthase [Tepidanaerobacter sp. GT38]|uniref:L-threonylcarbamoyladenylate synthase n=1 Tax=Tepidanaerobacter sp. GT38 TaxID=2722793 RepID=UPI001F0132F5|nr:L-threonylcarbamoyladenylate synthase [Tepidanaerobacter sp. GT38]MCG1012329.1 threonylcarbamoyl-AMP synthase [Tepidanaerobacter sp. GT38]